MMGEKCKLNNKGETMLEMMISIAIFALMMAFISSAFATANRIEVSNYDTRAEMNDRFSKVANAELDNDASIKELVVSSDITVKYTMHRFENGERVTGSFAVKSISDGVDGGFVKVEAVK